MALAIVTGANSDIGFSICKTLLQKKYKVIGCYYQNKEKIQIFEEFQAFFSKKGFILDDINLKIIPYFKKSDEIEQLEMLDEINIQKLDCSNSRVVSQNGVYSCAMLVGDYRARLGSSLADCSRVNYLDCEKCLICVNANSKVQANDWM